MTMRNSGDPIRDYLIALEHALRARGIAEARIVEEVRGHLLDTITEFERDGLTHEQACSQAVARLGDPGAMARRFNPRDGRMFSRLVTAICAFTLMVTAFLTLSVLALQPPRFRFWSWLLIAVLFAGQSVLTLLVLRGATARVMRVLTVAGAVAVAVGGAWWIYMTAIGPHFEGYALVLGSALTGQGALTLTWLALPERTRRAV
jgi:hypothetical protein